MALPESPCGGEIKTIRLERHAVHRSYQTAPVGARSKLVRLSTLRSRFVTRQPLWGRDQNMEIQYLANKERVTRQPLWGRDQNEYHESGDNLFWLPDSPCGGEIKTGSRGDQQCPLRYQTAPVGARSKRAPSRTCCATSVTRQPLWGRDQNCSRKSFAFVTELPDSPCGGEIKTAIPSQHLPTGIT